MSVKILDSKYRIKMNVMDALLNFQQLILLNPFRWDVHQGKDYWIANCTATGK